MSEKIKVLLSLRRKWRTQATKLRNNHYASPRTDYRDWYEANIYEACATNLSHAIDKLKEDAP